MNDPRLIAAFTAAHRGWALKTLRELIDQGYAGLDFYDDTRFIVAAPEPFLSEGEGALDALGASFLKTAPPGVKPTHVAALLPWAVFLALGLDAKGAPRVTGQPAGSAA